MALVASAAHCLVFCGNPDPTVDVTSPQFGTIQHKMGNEVRKFVLVGEVAFQAVLSMRSIRMSAV